MNWKFNEPGEVIFKKDEPIFSFFPINLDYVESFSTEVDKIYFDKDLSKDKSIGSPFFLDEKKDCVRNFKNVGILLSHGYKSAPMEVLSLGEFLNDSGYKVYGVRLLGHGTAPINLKNVSWHDWYDSMQRGYAALSNICEKIIIH